MMGLDTPMGDHKVNIQPENTYFISKTGYSPIADLPSFQVIAEPRYSMPAFCRFQFDALLLLYLRNS